jgi:CRP-like cAMP-binding protein
MSTATELSPLSRLLAAAETIRSCEPASVIFREGEGTLGIYTIHEGEVELLTSSKGAPHVVRRAGAGEILSLSQVVAGRPHDATAVVTSFARIGFVEKDAFLKLLNTNENAWPAVLQLLSEQIHSMYLAIKVGTKT